ncbi:MAG TPA: hypothetical protein VJL32_02110 [Candidatus Paceibacterota bacterium]
MTLTLVEAIALAGGLLNATAFLLYNRNIFVVDYGTRPNAASYVLWTVVLAVNLLTYRAMNNNWTIFVVMATDTTLCVVTAFFLWLTGKFGALNKRDWQVMLLGVVAVVVWQTSNATYGNFTAQVPMALAFLPTIRVVKEGSSLEDPRVWWLFVASFATSVINACLQWRGQPEDLTSPIVGLVMHAVVLAYAIRGRRLFGNRRAESIIG